MLKREKDWWKKATIYQIYPKSFMDSNGDGVGDIQGIISKLDYLQNLGIDGIWLSPVCKSPQKDNGYDISDYEDIDKLFGTMEDMKELILEAEKRKISIILDLVLNHTSNQHRWFKEALKGEDSPYFDYYIWRDKPNDMESVFKGPAWTYVPSLNKYYFHQFAKEQPDLNWENPKVREEIYKMINNWIDLGIGGFRLDVIDQIAKDPDKKITINGPKLHEYFRELNEKTFGKGNFITVGETWGVDLDRAKEYSNPKGDEFSMVFQFQHQMIDQDGEKWNLKEMDFKKLKDVFGKWQKGLHNNGWNSLFWNNHDLPRVISRFGDEDHREESGKALATILYGLEGTPYIYQGEEIGMTNVNWDIEDYSDIETLNYYNCAINEGKNKEEVMKSIHVKSRDNARTPMQWSDEKNCGFTTGKPWMKINDNYKIVNVKSSINNKNSLFYFYKKCIDLRKKYEVFTKGDYTEINQDNPKLFIYKRVYRNEELLVISNLGDETEVSNISNLESYTELISNNYKKEFRIQPYGCGMYHRFI